MEKLTLNQVMARSFINMIQFAMVADTVPNQDKMTAFRFQMLSDAQMSVLYSLAQLVSDRNEVMAEYDRLFTIIKQQAENSVSQMAMSLGRESLLELLAQTKSH